MEKIAGLTISEHNNSKRIINIDIENEKNVNSILEVVGQDKIEFIDGIKHAKTKEELKRVTSDAFKKDIFFGRR